MICASPKCGRTATQGYLYCAACALHMNMDEKADFTQVGGDHYKKQAIQPWTAMESWMTTEEFNGFLRGNVIKYLARYKDKNGLEDLKKAQHYLQKLIELNS